MGTVVQSKAPAELKGASHTFLQLLDECVADATITFIVDGSEYVVGKREIAGRTPNAVTIEVRRDRMFERVLAEANLGLAESYMDGDWEMVEGEVADFLTILLRNKLNYRIRKDWRLVWNVLRIRMANALRGKEGNIHKHYDVGVDLFESCLDRTMSYSCGYAQSPDDDLERLQRNKLDRICQKLKLKKSERVLDIGCGYGGLLIYAAENYGINGVGVTLSKVHCETAGRKAREAGLDGQVRIEYMDFNAVQGAFDKVVSVGMFEHVARREYKNYFGTIARVLEPWGMGLVHAIGCGTKSNVHDPFTQKYIFPDSNQPKLSEMAHHLEQQRLNILDVENMKPHYAYTARGWLRLFRQNKHTLDQTKYDLRFQRMWEYYLACAIAAAQASDGALYQVLFTKDYTAPVPLHRV